MTGAYIRVLRNGHWENIEIDQMTDDELDKFASEFPERGWMWAKFLARFIRNNFKEA